MNIKTKIKQICIVSLISLPFTSNVMAYKVWVNMNCSYKAVAQNTGKWQKTATAASGSFINLPGKPSIGTVRPNATDWKTIVKQFGTKPLMAPYTAVEIEKDNNGNVGLGVKTIIDKTFKSTGRVPTHIMLYNARGYTLSSKAFAQARSWLKNNGRNNIKLLWNARSNNLTDRKNHIDNNNVQEIVMEGSYENWGPKGKGNRAGALDYIWNDASKQKNVYFLIPVGDPANYPKGVNNYYSETRFLLRHIRDLQGNAFMRSNKVAFIPSAYEPKWNLSFYPEIEDKGPNKNKNFKNTLMGTALSLHRHKKFFEGFPGFENSDFKSFKINL